MIEKKTVIDKIEITRDGSIQIRFCLLVVDDGVEIASSYHRTAIEPGGDADAQIAAVNAGITGLRYPAVEADKIPLLKDVCRLVHTPDVVGNYRAKRAKASDQVA